MIRKGGVVEIKAAGLGAFKTALRGGSPLADWVDELKSFYNINLLSVSLDRLTRWGRPGLRCIGDAPYAISPVGGVGVNLAIRDAVAAVNLLAAKLKTGAVTDAELADVQRRRLFPVEVIQARQATIHNTVLQPALSSGHEPLRAP